MAKSAQTQQKLVKATHPTRPEDLHIVVTLDRTDECVLGGKSTNRRCRAVRLGSVQRWKRQNNGCRPSGGLMQGFALVVLLGTVLGCRGDRGERPQQEATSAQFPKGRPDNPTPQVSITSPADGAAVRGPELAVRIETRDFTFAYDRATTPGTKTTLPERYAMVPQAANEGHVHVYLARVPRGPEATPAKFYMVQSFVMPNAAEFVLRDVNPGTYRLLVELVQHDHTPRIKGHPTDWPSFDMITITVR
jgi:hypothetical protein